jgi:hypothetical protein
MLCKREERKERHQAIWISMVSLTAAHQKKKTKQKTRRLQSTFNQAPSTSFMNACLYLVYVLNTHRNKRKAVNIWPTIFLL